MLTRLAVAIISHIRIWNPKTSTKQGFTFPSTNIPAATVRPFKGRGVCTQTPGPGPLPTQHPPGRGAVFTPRGVGTSLQGHRAVLSPVTSILESGAAPRCLRFTFRATCLLLTFAGPAPQPKLPAAPQRWGHTRGQSGHGSLTLRACTGDGAPGHPQAHWPLRSSLPEAHPTSGLTATCCQQDIPTKLSSKLRFQKKPRLHQNEQASEELMGRLLT